jgi:hypothetical protein
MKEDLFEAKSADQALRVNMAFGVVCWNAAARAAACGDVHPSITQA